jgi:chromosome segregation ATPase
VDAAVSARDGRIEALRLELAAKAEIESELEGLSGMVLEREREIRMLKEQLQDANERYDRSIASLDTVTARLQEIEAQARGQATRIRMKALREAVEVGRRAQELSDAEAAPVDVTEVFEGSVKLEIGPLGDYAQLVGIEDAIGELGGTEISVERFSEGRATLSMNLEQPIELLRELEELSALEFNVRRTGDDNLILDVDEEQGPGQQAA